jgi:hypothetical protein
MKISTEINIEMDSQVPGGVYLCQVGGTVSCGACCGLYNVKRLDQDALTHLLARRTVLFRSTARTPEAMDEFVRQLVKEETQTRPYDDFHHCLFLGLVGGEHQRVGCLLHPLGDGNQGVDYRGLSYYGGMACRTYFCASVRTMEKRYKQILRLVLRDWYTYGLLVTETALVTALLRYVETRQNVPLDPERIAADAASRQSIGILLALKLEWPFRPASHATLCHFLFDDHLYPRPVIDYAGLGTTRSELDPILFQLKSRFEDVSQLRRAEAQVEERIQAVVDAIGKAPKA